jgi:thiamine-monophosphate kinase
VTLAVTTDGIVEEIEQGLYEDPFQIGWMTVTVNASDLAATGADPLGILVNATLPQDSDDRLVADLRRGIGAACDTYSLPLLGGDTNFSSRMQMCGVAIGTVPSGCAMTRRGCRPGDRLFSSGPLGLGSAYAVMKLMNDGTGPIDAVRFAPHARLSEARLIRRFANSCMDTSDGMVATLDQLARVNGVGFVVEVPLVRLLHPGAATVCGVAGIPAWMMLAGPHGEFELLFTVTEDRAADLSSSCRSCEWTPIEVGSVVSEQGLWINDAGTQLAIDTSRVRDLFFEPGVDIDRYVTGLMQSVQPVA